jgi:hypothetical protein
MLTCFIFLVQTIIFDFLDPKFRFWALTPYFRLFDPQKYIFFTRCEVLDHTNISFLGSEGLFSPFYPQKYIFFCFLWSSRSMDILHDYTDLGFQIPFLTPKSIFFLVPFKISDRWIYHTNILFRALKFRFWALQGPSIRKKDDDSIICFLVRTTTKSIQFINKPVFFVLIFSMLLFCFYSQSSNNKKS